MASRDSGTVRPTKRKHVFFTAAVLLIVCVLAAGAVSAETTVFVNSNNFSQVIKENTDPTLILIITEDIGLGPSWDQSINANITLTTTKNKNNTIFWEQPTQSGPASMFTISNDNHLTITGNGTGTLTLDGSNSRESQNLVKIESGGYFTLKMGGVLANSTAPSGRAVYVDGGTFMMEGGSIVNNTADHGETVYVDGGTFTMKGGTISNNKANSGGAVMLEEAGKFTMEGGTISNNIATMNGGGVFMKNTSSTFTMEGGTISNNIANNKSSETNLGTGHGGGVHIDEGTFTMSSGTISGNTAKENGGGVYVHLGGTFTMSGGTITDNTATSNGNGVYVGSIFNLEGNGMVDSVYLPDGKNITVIGSLTGTETQVRGIIPETPREYLPVVDLAAVQKNYLPWFHLDESVKNFALTYVPNEQKQGLVLTPIYTVTFNANGGTSVPSQMKVVSGNTVEKPKTTREGYTLEGWYYNTMHDTMKWDFTRNTVKDNITLTANWTRNTYTVTFEANGGSEVQPQTVNHGDTVSEPDDPARDDHTFAGWHEDASFITLWDFDTQVTKDLTLHAKWTPNKPEPEPPSGGSSGDGNMDNAYRVLFNDGAATLYVVTDLSAGDKLTKPEDPVKDGYTFAGWHKDTACTQAWDFNDGITGSMTLYAKWTPQETVTPTATATPTVTATATITSTPTGDTSPAPTVQPDTNGNSNTNGETTATSGISLPYLIGGIAILLLAILLLLFLLLRHTVTFLIPTGGELEEYRIKVWHGRYINTEDLPDLIRTAAWYRDTERQERWDFDQDRVKKSIELYLG